MWTELEELMQEEQTHNLLKLPRMVEGIQPQGPPEVAVFPRCNNVHIESYRRMATDPPLVDPRGEKLLGPREEGDATPGATYYMTVN